MIDAPLLDVQHLCVTLQRQSIVRDVSLQLFSGDLLAVLGPNGCGKTTLLRAMVARLPHAGTVRLLGRDMADYPPKERARLLAVLTQQATSPLAYTAREVVQLGRYPYQSGLFGEGHAHDRDAVERAMAFTGVAHLADRSLDTLSGGEAQRVHLARALAQEPRILLLDEPTNHLDIAQQIALMDLVRDWARETGHAALAILHDLPLAKAYANRTLLMRDGATVAYGPTAQTLSRENLQAVYGLDVYDWLHEQGALWQ